MKMSRMLTVALASSLRFSTLALLTSRTISRSLTGQRSAAGLSTSLLADAVQSARTGADSSEVKSEAKKIPVTVLSGFLGAGKTSFLNHVLNHKKTERFGLVVNDMASINIDSKQIKQQVGANSLEGIETMELQNGCVCCSLAEDLIASISNLMSLSEIKGEPYNHMIVECSGIAEPRKIRDLFHQAEDYNLSLLSKIQLDTFVTIVDATVFLKLFGTEQDIMGNANLAYELNDEAMGTLMEDGSGHRKVTELLLEQVECADIVLVNKCDLLESDAEQGIVEGIIRSINPSARILSSVRGKAIPAAGSKQSRSRSGSGSGSALTETGELEELVVEPLDLIGCTGGKGMVAWGILDEHRNLVKHAEQAQQASATSATATSTAGDTTTNTLECADSTCTDVTHDHSHAHSHAATAAAASPSSSSGSTAECKDSTCTDPTHNHDHSHNHSLEHHSHDHHDHKSHTTATVEACADPVCTDPTHDHSHTHSHAHGADAIKDDITTAQERFGITSFAYKRRRPFHPIRFARFLQGMGKLSIGSASELAGVAESAEKSVASEKEKTTMAGARKALLRSKGFVWMATSRAAAYFMSHAGQYLELVVLGRWWGDIPRSEWPEDLVEEITADFPPGEADTYSSISSSSSDNSYSGSGIGIDSYKKHGDRRQELVFIGMFDQDPSGGNSQRALEEVLDECLLTDEEMQIYENVSEGGDVALRAAFVPDYKGK